MPPSSTGEDNATCQVRTFNTKVYDLKLKVVDQTLEARIVGNSPITIATTWAPWPTFSATTDQDTGEVTVPYVPAGEYIIDAVSPVTNLYNPSLGKPKARVTANVIDAPLNLLVPLPIYDATIQLVNPFGGPIAGATVTVGVKPLEGVTGPDGKILAPSIPGGSYTVGATLYGKPINPTLALNVGMSRLYVLPAGNMALVTVKVTGTSNQGLTKAAVTVKLGTTQIFSDVTNEDGILTLWLPKETYTIAVSHKGFSDSKSVPVTGDTTVEFQLQTFIELFGQDMSFATFALWIVAVIVVALILVIAAQEYNIYRRKKMPQLFGAGPAR
jgi:hypothetical protein